MKIVKVIFLGMVGLALLVGFFFMLGQFDILKFNEIRDDAMLPAYPKGKMIISSKLLKISNDKVVVCRLTATGPSPEEKKNIAIRSIAGMEGDTIEINDGYLIRNGYMVDNPDQLMLTYYAHRSAYVMSLSGQFNPKPKEKGDSIIFCLNYKEYKKHDREILLHKITKPKSQEDPNVIGSTTENGWNIYNYGPIVIPKGYCFLLASNRDLFKDSRQLGFIPLKDIIAVVQ
jgi:signal peptidase I